MENKIMFNYSLLDTLLEGSGRVAQEVYKEADIPRQTWVDWRNGITKGVKAGAMPVDRLLKMLNTLRVPARFLFMHEGESVPQYALSELYLPRQMFRANKYNHNAFLDIFLKRNREGKSIDAMLKDIGVSWTIYTKWVEGVCPRMWQLLAVCNLYGYSLDKFIIGSHKECSVDKVVHIQQDLSIEEKQELEIKQLKKRLEALKNKYNQLEKENERLKADNIRLTGEAMEAQHDNLQLRKALGL